MPERTGPTDERPACGESSSAGWCPNPDCDERPEAAGRPAGDHDGTGSPLPDGGTDDVQREETVIGGTADRDADGGGTEGGPALEVCPDCGADVDPGDNYCASCGQDLEAIGTGDLLSECPACRAEVGPGKSFCSSCGENLEAHRVGDDAPESLLLATRGQEIAVGDGDTVGRELRRVVIETGGDQTQAVRIHREHLEFVRENGQFHVVDLGTNPTRLNGRPLEKGDREPVSPGDEIEVSGVVGFVIREP
jgi:hypothetical protein